MESHDNEDRECARVERRAEFLEGVQRGIAAADRGDLIDHDEVVNRIERLLQP